MTWHAVYTKATGDLYSLGTVLADPVPPQFGVKSYPTDVPPNIGKVWSSAALDFIVKVQKKFYTQEDFVNALTQTELENLLDFSFDVTKPIPSRKRVRAFWELLKVKPLNCNLQKAQDELTALETVGVLGPGRAVELIG
jgi:hypothetical protein